MINIFFYSAIFLFEGIDKARKNREPYVVRLATSGDLNGHALLTAQLLLPI